MLGVIEKHRTAAHGIPDPGARGLAPLLAAARAWAWLDGREHVIPEDVQNVLSAVAGHRLHASQREGGRVLHGRELVGQLIQAVRLP